MRSWSKFPPNIGSRWLVWITHITWTWPLLYPQHIINFQNGVKKNQNPIGFGIISERREEQQKASTFPESSCTQILPKAALCEMECEMSAFNIPAVDYTVHIMLRVQEHPPSRLGVCPRLALPATQVYSLFTECQRGVKELEKSYLWNRLREISLGVTQEMSGSQQTFPKLTFKPV